MTIPRDDGPGLANSTHLLSQPTGNDASYPPLRRKTRDWLSTCASEDFETWNLSAGDEKTHFRDLPRTVSVLMKVIPEEHSPRIARSQESW